MVRRAEQGCETRVAVEARPAQPIYGAVATDEGRGCTITDQRIVLDGHRKIRAYRHLLPIARLGDNTYMREFRLDLWDGRRLRAIARDDRGSILGQRGIELVYNDRNNVLHWPTHVDADRILVGIRPLQNCELSVEKGCRRNMLFACGQARANQRPVAVQIDDTHPGSPTREEVAIAALEHRAGDHARLTCLPPAIDTVCDPFDQRPLVPVIEWSASVHFADGRRRMEVGALLEWPVESLREGRRDRGFPAARDAGDNQDCRIVRHGGAV